MAPPPAQRESRLLDCAISASSLSSAAAGAGISVSGVVSVGVGMPLSRRILSIVGMSDRRAWVSGPAWVRGVLSLGNEGFKTSAVIVLSSFCQGSCGGQEGVDVGSIGQSRRSLALCTGFIFPCASVGHVVRGRLLVPRSPVLRETD